ncbi:MAG TPA: ATP-dependent Clp protease ATP-binding subunit [Leptolyngbyaceae cyanobacterium M65_K2018_010]|nr:ATP-dependent Clp protease ATP-binding subunit [Leptolyngbyaceae cyanobacterium M65_K2018_010]
MFEHFTNTAIAVIMKAQEEARRLRHNFVGTEQLLLGLIKEDASVAARVLDEFGVNLNDARAEVEAIIGRGSGSVPPEIPFTPKVKQVFEQAFQEARKMDAAYIEPEHLLLSLTQNSESVAYRVLTNLGVDPAKVRTRIIQELGEAAAVPAGRRESNRERESSRKRGKVLAEFGTDLTARAAQGKIDPVVGRAKEIERVVQILGRRTKNNPILVGEPGVGKTAIAEGLAQRIVNQDVPEALLSKRVISLDMGSLVSGTRFRGDFEERLTQLVEEVRQDPDVVLVIDEIHTLIGAGSLEGGMDAANLLKPALARGEMQCIGATTLDEFRKYIERDAALERRFQPVMVDPPSVDDTIEILQGIRSRYEQFHQVTITDAALVAAARLSDRYISDRHLPDKAIDLIDEAGSQVKLRFMPKYPSKDLKQKLRQINKDLDESIQLQDFGKANALRTERQALLGQLQAEVPEYAEAGATLAALPVVDEESIADVVAAWTGIPVNRMTETESARLMHLEEVLHERVIGQHEAVVAVSKAIRRARSGLASANRPIASLVFSGPTGVGKTELSKALAVALFGSEEAMIRLDMSEFMESHTVSKLIGSPPGFVGYDEGGQLTEAVRRKPYTVILLDEIEKAHPDVFNLLLQVLDDGLLTDSKGRTVSFKNTLIIMTSNIGSQVIEKGGSSLGFDLATDVANSQYNNIRNLVNEEMKQYFRPELLNRLDEIIVFRQLTRDEVNQVADLMLDQVNKRLADRQISVTLSEAFRHKLAETGYDQRYGARPMRRAIARLVEDTLAEAILAGDLADGGEVLLDVDPAGNPVVKPVQQPALVGAHS